MRLNEIARQVLLTSKVSTYKADSKEILDIIYRESVKTLPNQVELDKEYRKYMAYRKINNKKIMNSYYSTKTRDNRDLIKSSKLSKEKFMEMYNNHIINKNIARNAGNVEVIMK